MLVVTGAQRSGTRYLATILADAGVRATHEGNPPGTGWRDHDPRDGPRLDVDVDVCWHAAWWLGTDALAGSFVVHLVRGPLASIASSVERRTFWRPRPSGRWALRCMPDLGDADSNVEITVRYWVRWNELIEPHADRRLRVEDATTSELAGILDAAGVAYNLNALAAAMTATPRDVNANSRRRKLSWPEIPQPWRSHAQRLAVRYGYRTAEPEPTP